MNKTTIPFPNYKGVSVEFNDSKISPELKEHFIKEIEPEQFKNHIFSLKTSYFVGGFQVFTVPLKQTEYSVNDEQLGQLIFVNSKLPRVERTRVVKDLIVLRQTKEKEVKTMKNNKEKIILPIEIGTSFPSKNKFEDAQLQIELTSHYLSALFWFMKTAVEGYDLLDIQTDNVLFDFVEFRGNVGLVCELGEALSNSLTIYSGRLQPKSEPKKYPNNKTKQ